MKIDGAREMLIKNNPESALAELEKIKKEAWSTVSDNIKFRIITNIAVADIEMQKIEEGAKLFIEALQYNKEDEKALTNTAYGYVLLNQKKKSLPYIKKAIAKNPANFRSYSVLVQASDQNQSLKNIINLVPEEYRNEPEVSYAFAMYAKDGDNLEDAAKWLEIANSGTEKNQIFRLRKPRSF